MTALAVSLNTSLASTGLSAAEAGQIAATKNTLDKSFDKTQSTSGAPSEEKKPDDSEVRISDRSRELSAAEKREVQRLQQIDAEVRAHEEAHINAGRGVVTSGPVYTYASGPDGRQYAIAGEVGIDTAPEKKPEANIDKGQRIQEAALAPSQPSPQDYQVAATGSQLEAQGRSDLAQARLRERAEAAYGDRANRSETQAQVDLSV